MSYKFIKVFILIIFCFSLFVPILYAQEVLQDKYIDEETKAICNNVMRNIYYDILDNKGRYKELVNFGEDVLYENKYGILTIVYQYDKEGGGESNQQKDPYAFGITIDKMDDKMFQNRVGAFDYGFPVLELKISGYQNKHSLRTQYDIIPLIHKYGVLLSSHQQRYLSLQITMKAGKRTFSVGEDVFFDVTLKNVSKRHMVIKAMNSDTMYFLINNKFWGTRPEFDTNVGGEKIVLKSGEEVTTRFKGDRFQRPQEVEIMAIYRVTINEVNPSTRLKIKIVEARDPLEKLTY